MNAFGILFGLLTGGMLLMLPPRLVPLPLLMGAACISLEQQLEIGPLHFPLFRVLVLLGALRVMVKGEGLAGGKNSLDRMMLLWGGCLLLTSVFHKSTVLVFRLGVLFDAWGSYFLFRVFIRDLEDIRRVFKMVCILLLPVSANMLVEKLKGINLLGTIGFGMPYVAITNGHFRAAGTFGHPILAGTVGAVCLPMAVALWRVNRKVAVIGMVATLGVVYASGSSGPIMATLSVLAALAAWKIQGHMRALRWLTLVLLIALDCVMNDPVYFLMARIDITGGSTGYFRAQLIRSAIEHLGEWWMAGTDYTRHWMPSGIAANADHTDMTNYYLAMGVWGGIALMLVFFGVVVAGFSRIGKVMKANRNSAIEDRFLIWTLGAILFGHATTFMSISYFDQTVVFLYLSLAIIGSLPLYQTVMVPSSNEETWTPGTPEPEQYSFSSR